MYSFGERSTKVLNTIHPDLQQIVTLALVWSRVDFCLVEGHRPVEVQQDYFKKGLTKIDGLNAKGKHSYSPSLAVDFCAWVPGMPAKSYDKIHLAYIAGIMQAAAVHLLATRQISHKLRWGANWDGDGVLVFDQNFLDMPHVELEKI